MFEQICRTCLATCGDLVSIFSNDYYVQNLPDKLLHTIRIEVLMDDDLPKMMCKKCIFLIDSLYCFKSQCELAEVKLKRSLKDGFDITSDTNIFGYNDKMYDSCIPVEHNSDAITSSEEDYQIEYASEEARLEVENALKQNQNTKKKLNKSSGVKVKSVEILPTETKDNIYKNLNLRSSYKSQTPELEEGDNMSDSDDETSLYTSEYLKKITSDLSDNVNYQLPFRTTTEKIQFFKNLKSKRIKPGVKRKLENEPTDNSFNQLTKVPKKVMFKDNDFEDENIQFIEMSENQSNKVDESTLSRIEEDLNTALQVNIIENTTGKVFQNYTSFNTDNTSKNSVDPLPSSEAQKTTFEGEAKRALEVRMQSLIKHVVLNIPEICVECSESFESHLDVLKHRLQIHLNKNVEHFFCPVCHKKFFTNNNVIEHLKEHTDIQSLFCVLCSSNFYTMAALRNHLISHVDLNDLKCQICSKKHQPIQTLLCHLEQHLSSEQLVCIFCSDEFDSKDLLQNHINKNHKKRQTEVKCKSQTNKKQVSQEKVDDKNITSFPCPYCEHTFSTKTTLRDHVFTHLGVQQYSCLVCEKIFNSQEERTQHMQEHMKPQPKNDRKKFRCRVCHEILISRFAYGQHLKEKHWNSKQTSEILKELSETSISDKVTEQVNKNSITTPPASDSITSV